MWFFDEDKTELLYATEFQFGVVYEGSNNTYVTPIKITGSLAIELGAKIQHLVLILSGSDAGSCYLPVSKNIKYRATNKNISIKLSK